MKNIITFLSFLFLGTLTYGQVQSVNYGIKFNPSTCLFDAYMKVMDGETSSDRDRIQFNSQISVVVPAGSTVSLQKSHAPFFNNLKERGIVAAPWIISNFNYSPTVNQNIDIYGITPKTFPVAAYNDLKAGDEVVLFSLSVYPIVNCANDIRIFVNSEDPSSSDAGMNGGDFSNGFTIGSAEQRFNSSEATITPTNDFIQDFKLSSGKANVVTYNLNTDLGECQTNLNYKWIAPNGKVLGTTADVPSTLFTNVQTTGKYKFEVKDEMGCIETVEFAPLTANNQAEVVSNGNTTQYGNVLESVNYPKGTFGVSIFPNPAKDFVNISIKTENNGSVTTGSFYDVSGKIVKANILNVKNNGLEHNLTIPINLPSGVYNIGLTSDNRNVGTYKLIVVE